MFLVSFSSMMFMQGISHPFQTPAHILLVLALGILIAQQQKKIFNLIAFSVSIIIGLIINQLINSTKVGF